MNNTVIDKFGNKYWYNESGKLHRENGPACEWHNGDREWYLNGILHREDGPACEYSSGSGNKFWCVNGMLHRLDGPAVEYRNGNKEYWINDKRYSSLDEGLMDQALY